MEQPMIVLLLAILPGVERTVALRQSSSISVADTHFEVYLEKQNFTENRSNAIGADAIQQANLHKTSPLEPDEASRGFPVPGNEFIDFKLVGGAPSSAAKLKWRALTSGMSGDAVAIVTLEPQMPVEEAKVFEVSIPTNEAESLSFVAKSYAYCDVSGIARRQALSVWNDGLETKVVPTFYGVHQLEGASCMSFEEFVDGAEALKAIPGAVQESEFMSSLSTRAGLFHESSPVLPGGLKSIEESPATATLRDLRLTIWEQDGNGGPTALMDVKAPFIEASLKDVMRKIGAENVDASALYDMVKNLPSKIFDLYNSLGIPLRVGDTHGDMHLLNVMVSKMREIKLIDFDEYFPSNLQLFDLGYVLFVERVIRQLEHIAQKKPVRVDSYRPDVIESMAKAYKQSRPSWNSVHLEDIMIAIEVMAFVPMYELKWWVVHNVMAEEVDTGLWPVAQDPLELKGFQVILEDILAPYFATPYVEAVPELLLKLRPWLKGGDAYVRKQVVNHGFVAVLRGIVKVPTHLEVLHAFLNIRCTTDPEMVAFRELEIPIPSKPGDRWELDAKSIGSLYLDHTEFAEWRRLCFKSFGGDRSLQCLSSLAAKIPQIPTIFPQPGLDFRAFGGYYQADPETQLNFERELGLAWAKSSPVNWLTQELGARLAHFVFLVKQELCTGFSGDEAAFLRLFAQLFLIHPECNGELMGYTHEVEEVMQIFGWAPLAKGETPPNRREVLGQAYCMVKFSPLGKSLESVSIRVPAFKSTGGAMIDKFCPRHSALIKQFGLLGALGGQLNPKTTKFAGIHEIRKRFHAVLIATEAKREGVDPLILQSQFVIDFFMPELQGWTRFGFPQYDWVGSWSDTVQMWGGNRVKRFGPHVNPESEIARAKKWILGHEPLTTREARKAVNSVWFLANFEYFDEDIPIMWNGSPVAHTARKDLVYPMVSGCSGTANMLSMLYSFLGFTVDEMVAGRVSYLADMLVGSQHSFFEIMLSADPFMPPDCRLQAGEKRWEDFKQIMPRDLILWSDGKPVRHQATEVWTKVKGDLETAGLWDRMMPNQLFERNKQI